MPSWNLPSGSGYDGGVRIISIHKTLWCYDNEVLGRQLSLCHVFFKIAYIQNFLYIARQKWVTGSDVWSIIHVNTSNIVYLFCLNGTKIFPHRWDFLILHGYSWWILLIFHKYILFTKVVFLSNWRWPCSPHITCTVDPTFYLPTSYQMRYGVQKEMEWFVFNEIFHNKYYHQSHQSLQHYSILPACPKSVFLRSIEVFYFAAILWVPNKTTVVSRHSYNLNISKQGNTEFLSNQN